MNGTGVVRRRAFEHYDINQNGSIDKEEFVGLMRDLGGPTTGWRLDEAFNVRMLSHGAGIYRSILPTHEA